MTLLFFIYAKLAHAYMRQTKGGNYMEELIGFCIGCVLAWLQLHKWRKKT